MGKVSTFPNTGRYAQPAVIIKILRMVLCALLLTLHKDLYNVLYPSIQCVVAMLKPATNFLSEWQLLINLLCTYVYCIILIIPKT